MSNDLSFRFDLHPTVGGTPEENATTGFLDMRANGRSLTRLYDALGGMERAGPLVPGVHAARWLLDNWWRLRFEPLRNTYDWHRAHRMTEIGEGWVWPVVTIRCMNNRAILRADPSRASGDPTIRYFGAGAVEMVPAEVLEREVDAFAAQMLDKLAEAGIRDDDLHRFVADLAEERADPDLTALRVLEAHLGVDPDALDEEMLRTALSRRDTMGRDALDEVAAHCGEQQARALVETLQGIEASSLDTWAPENALSKLAPLPDNAYPADKGVWMAHRAREAIGNMGDPLSNERLAEMLAIPTRTLGNEYGPKGKGVGFSWRRDRDSTFRLEARRGTGKRFEAARLLGDHLMFDDPLHPATASRTARQAAQKAFAAELLCPIALVRDRLGDDLSQDAQDGVAEVFDVSPKTIEMLLKNNGVIERTDKDVEELYGIAA